MLSRPLKVALLFEYPTLNGGERSMLAALDAARQLHPRFEPIALAPSTGRLAQSLASAGVAHLPFDVRRGSEGVLPRDAVLARLAEIVRTIEPALLHANSLSMSRITGAVSESVGIPTTGHLRDMIGLSGAAIADLNRNRRLIAVSHATRAFHVKQGVTDRIEVLWNGVDLDRFAPRSRTGRLIRELRLSEPVLIAATIGQIALRKGHDTLAEAAVLAAQTLPQLHYVWIGERHSTKAESVEFERAAKQRFSDAGIADRLHCLGPRDDVPELLSEVDLLVHPARQEPLGRVLLEAAASETPIVATDVGGTREIVDDCVSARLVPPNNPTRLANAIVEVASDPALRRALSAAARQSAAERFDVKTSAQRLLEFWTHVAGH